MKIPVLGLAPLSLLLVPALAAQEEHAAGPLTVEGGLMFWTIVVFLVLLAVLKKFAWPAVLGAVEAREKARAVAMEKTKQEQEELLARARREIAAERDRAVADLRREAVDLSLAAASKLVGQRLDGDADRALVLNYLKSLGQQN